ncbi:MAG: C40 family peptidase [Gemmatimonadaceae bacterium]
MSSRISAHIARVLVGSAVALTVATSQVHAQSALKGIEAKKPFAALSASAESLADSIVARARGQIGTRYKLGGVAANRALDCSGLVKVVMSALDVVLPRTAKQQATVGTPIPKDLAALKPGDLLTFGRGKKISHIGIYVGEGRMVHASTSKRRVIETALTPRSSLMRQWKGARRILDDKTAHLRDSLLAIADTLR